MGVNLEKIGLEIFKTFVLNLGRFLKLFGKSKKNGLNLGCFSKKEHLPAKLREAWAQNVQD